MQIIICILNNIIESIVELSWNGRTESLEQKVKPNNNLKTLKRDDTYALFWIKNFKKKRAHTIFIAILESKLSKDSQLNLYLALRYILQQANFLKLSSEQDKYLKAFYVKMGQGGRWESCFKELSSSLKYWSIWAAQMHLLMVLEKL